MTDNVQLAERLARLEERVGSFEEKFDTIDHNLVGLRDDVKDMVRAWNAGSTVLNFVKFIASILTAITIVWAAIKLVFPHGTTSH